MHLIGRLGHHADAQVVVFFVGKIRADMASCAACLVAEEELATAGCTFANGTSLARLLESHVLFVQFFVLFFELVEVCDIVGVSFFEIGQLQMVIPGSGAGNESALETGNRTTDVVDRHAVLLSIVTPSSKTMSNCFW